MFNKSAIAALAETRIKLVKLFFKFQVKKADDQFEKETRKLLSGKNRLTAPEVSQAEVRYY